MKNNVIYQFIFVVVVILAASVSGFSQRSGAVRQNNQLEGRVVDERNLAVSNAYVEIYTDWRSLLFRTRTSSQGRFTFRGLASGRYYIEVKPFGTNLLEEERMVELFDQTGSGQVYYEEFRLSIDKRFLPAEATMIGTIYAQEVPNDARRLFKSGVNKINEGKNEGRTDLESAIAAFPNYFDALNVLGRYLISQNKFEEGYPYLLKAIDVNSRCAECFYSLGFAFYKLNQIPAGLKATGAAVFLEPTSPQSNLLHGTLLRLTGDFVNAEKALLKSKVNFKDKNYEVHWQLALLYNRMKRHSEAVTELELYLKTKPNVTSAERNEVRKLIVQMNKEPRSS